MCDNLLVAWAACSFNKSEDFELKRAIVENKGLTSKVRQAASVRL